MQLKIINSNHAELICYSFMTICFSYGRCAAIKRNGVYHVNDDVYGFSKTTSQHINYTFPELKQKLKDNDINVLHYSGDDAIEDVLCELLPKEYYMKITLENADAELIQKFIDWLRENEEVYTESQIEEFYDEMLDEDESSERFSGSYILKNLDPTAYRCGLIDYIDSFNNIVGDLYSELYEDTLFEMFMQERGCDEDLDEE